MDVTDLFAMSPYEIKQQRGLRCEKDGEALVFRVGRVIYNTQVIVILARRNAGYERMEYGLWTRGDGQQRAALSGSVKGPGLKASC